jgi:hypothetical protein
MGVEVWGLHEGWEETDNIHRKLKKKVLGVLRFSGKSVAKSELGRNNTREKVLCTL